MIFKGLDAATSHYIGAHPLLRLRHLPLVLPRLRPLLRFPLVLLLLQPPHVPLLVLSLQRCLDARLFYLRCSRLLTRLPVQAEGTGQQHGRQLSPSIPVLLIILLSLLKVALSLPVLLEMYPIAKAPVLLATLLLKTVLRLPASLQMLLLIDLLLLLLLVLLTCMHLSRLLMHLHSVTANEPAHLVHFIMMQLLLLVLPDVARPWIFVLANHPG